MDFLFLILFFCFFIFLYILYFLSKDDFVFVRKSVSLDKVFNIAILTSAFTLFFSRIFYAIFSSHWNILNPLVFLAFPYFPGLSLIGGLVGGAIFLYFYAGIKNLPVGRIFDLLAMSFLGVFPIGYFLIFIFHLGKTSVFFNIMFILSFIYLLVFVKFIFPFASKGDIKDGSLGFLFFIFFSFSIFMLKLFLNMETFTFTNLENLFLLLTFFGSLVAFLNQEIMDKFLSKK